MRVRQIDRETSQTTPLLSAAGPADRPITHRRCDITRSWRLLSAVLICLAAVAGLTVAGTADPADPPVFFADPTGPGYAVSSATAYKQARSFARSNPKLIRTPPQRGPAPRSREGKRIVEQLDAELRAHRMRPRDWKAYQDERANNGALPFLYPNRLVTFYDPSPGTVSGNNVETGITVIPWLNVVSSTPIVDRLRGDRLVSRAYGAAPPAQRGGAPGAGVRTLPPTTYYSSAGETEPRFRVNSRGVVDEVYQNKILQCGDRWFRRLHTIHLSRPAEIDRVTFLAKRTNGPLDQFEECDEWWRQAQAKLTLPGLAYEVYEDYLLWANMEFKIREQLFSGQQQWVTDYYYDSDGTPSGSDISIVDRGPVLEIGEGRPPAQHAVRTVVFPPKPANEVDMGKGNADAWEHTRDLFRKLPPSVKLIENKMSTSWGATLRQFRPADPDPSGRVLYEVGAQHRLFLEWDSSDRPLKGLVLDRHLQPMGVFCYGADPFTAGIGQGDAGGRVRADTVFTPERVRLLAPHISGADLWQGLATLGVQPETLLVQVFERPFLAHGVCPATGNKQLSYDVILKGVAEGLPLQPGPEHPPAQIPKSAELVTRYLLPVDPPMGREIARVTTIGDRADEEQFTATLWWGAPSIRTKEPPFGIAHQILTIRNHDRVHWLRLRPKNADKYAETVPRAVMTAPLGAHAYGEKREPVRTKGLLKNKGVDLQKR